MNCPRCQNDDWCEDYGNRDKYLYCMHCGWQTDGLAKMATESSSYLLAKLQAQGAEPGWYGPDGMRAEVMSPHPSGWGHRIQVKGCAVSGETWEETIKKARLCGFVEVTHEPR